MLFSRMIFAMVRFAARNGLALAEPPAPSAILPKDAKQRARHTGIRGETYAYWYLRRRGYVFLARNYTLPGIKGELDLVGYDGKVLAFIEVKTRAPGEPDFGLPEDAVTSEKRRLLSRVRENVSPDLEIAAVTDRVLARRTGRSVDAGAGRRRPQP